MKEIDKDDEYIAELEAEEQDAKVSGEQSDAKISEYGFRNPDPYAKVKPKADSEAKHKFTRDAEGRIVVKNLAAYWLPELKLTEEIGGTEYTVTGSYDGDETLDKKLDRILKENLKEGIREDSE